MRSRPDRRREKRAVSAPAEAILDPFADVARQPGEAQRQRDEREAERTGTTTATSGMPMIVTTSAMQAAISTGTKKIAAARPTRNARTGSAAGAAADARDRRARDEQHERHHDGQQRNAEDRAEQRQPAAEVAESTLGSEKPPNDQLPQSPKLTSLTLPRSCAPSALVSRAADQHDIAAHVGLRPELDVAADHDDAVAHAAVDAQRSADHHDRIADFFVAGNRDAAADGHARAGRPIDLRRPRRRL